jgi:phenylpropionate dioxygenase-like ring-hydroxylating dioxygenase large terminal subunit
MLSTADEHLCRIGPGTPMGNLMRQYWLPAIRSDELIGADGSRLRVRLLGENLIGFRASDGQVGLIQNNCPHRGASLFFGRNEEAGLRIDQHDTVVSILHRPCNWTQGWEGEMDTVHQAFLHAGATRVENTTPGTFDYFIARTPGQ